MKKIFSNKIVQTILIILALIVWGALKVYQAESRAARRYDKQMKEDIKNSIDESFKDFKLAPLGADGSQ
ncbi:hypothetical protein K1X76_12220 [bacterium]|nr:hypothetical protein [bacterium]